MTPVENFAARMFAAGMATNPQRGLDATACARIFTIIEARTRYERAWFKGLVEADAWIRPHPGQSLIVWLEADGSVCNVDMRPTDYATETAASRGDAILIATSGGAS